MNNSGRRQGGWLTSEVLGLCSRGLCVYVALFVLMSLVPAVTPEAEAHLYGDAQQSESFVGGTFEAGGSFEPPNVTVRDVEWYDPLTPLAVERDLNVNGACPWRGTFNTFQRPLDAARQPLGNFDTNSTGYSQAWCYRFAQAWDDGYGGTWHESPRVNWPSDAVYAEVQGVEDAASTGSTTPNVVWTATGLIVGDFPAEATGGQCNSFPGSGLDAANPTVCNGDPVNTATGSFYTSVADLSLPGVGMPFKWARHYNSMESNSGPLGKGWTFSYGPTIQTNAQGNPVLRNEQGQKIIYKTDGCGVANPEWASSRLSLIRGSGDATAYTQEVLADSPGGFWEHDEASGTSAADSSGNGNGGTYQNGVVLGGSGATQGSTAVTLDGVNDWVSIPGSTSTDPSPAYTIEAWVKPTSTARHSIILRTNSSGPGSAWSHQLRITNGKFEHYAYDGSGRLVTGTTTVKSGKWYHVVGTATNGGTMKLFVNGQQEGAPASVGTLWGGGDRWNVGSSSGDGTGYLGGQIDGVAMYRSALTQTRIAAHYTQGLTCAPLQGYELERNDGSVLVFNASGKLTSITDRNGNDMTFTYTNGGLSSITDTVGRTIAVTTNVDGHITNVELPDGREVTYGYTNGLLTSITDARGNTTDYSYDSNGLLASIIDQNNHTVVENTYSNGRVVEQEDGRGKITTFDWNPSTGVSTMTDARGKEWKDYYVHGYLVRQVDPEGNSTKFSYNQRYNLATVTDPRGNQTKMTYDGRGNLLKRKAPAPLSYVETWTYNSRNDVTSYTDAKNRTTTFSYDSNGNLIKVTKPGTTEWEFGRSSTTGSMTSITDPRDKVTTVTYNSSGLPSAITSPAGGQTSFEYDTTGRVIGVIDPRGNAQGATPADFKTIYAYDAANHVTSVTTPLGKVTEWAYDPAGNLDSLTDAKDRTTDYSYNTANHLTSVTAPGSIVTSYTYDDVGNLTSRTDPEQHTTSYAYDDANRLTSVTGPLARIWSYVYDPNGNVTSVTDANGNATTQSGDGTTTYAYDVLNRLSSIDYSDSTPDVGLSYDATSQLTQMTDGAGTETYAYDSLDRLTSITRGSDVISYAYDAGSNVTSRTYPGASALAYAYDDDGRLASVTRGSATTSYGYDAAGRLTNTVYPSGNGFTESRTYDRDGRVTEIKNTSSSTTLSDFDYTYDDTGNPTSVSSLQGSTDYAYDALDRLTEACFASPCTDYLRYTYDDVGNRLTEERPAGTTSYSYNAADELTSTTSGGVSTNFGHDSNGNTTTAGSDSMTYDLANRTKTVTQGSSTATYSYDGLGKRLQTSTGTNNSNKTNFLWDPTWSLPELVLERDGAGAELRRYTYANGPVSMTSGASDYYYHRDALGSVTNLTNGSGAEQWSYAYAPFGVTTSTAVASNPAGNPLTFTGQYEDATGLFHLRARQYDATVGRFNSRDPIDSRYGATYVSLYAYAGNRATTATDPSGLMPIHTEPEVDFLEAVYPTLQALGVQFDLPPSLQALGIEGKIYTGPSSSLHQGNASYVDGVMGPDGEVPGCSGGEKAAGMIAIVDGALFIAVGTQVEAGAFAGGGPVLAVAGGAILASGVVLTAGGVSYLQNDCTAIVPEWAR